MTAAASGGTAVAPQPWGVRAGLQVFFFLTRWASAALRWLKPLAIPLALWGCPTTRANLCANSLRIFGRRLPAAEQRAFERGVVGNFFDFVVDMGKSGNDSLESILGRIDSIEGEPAYLTARQLKRGAVLVTAHMGTFEVGLAALRRVEPAVHVVFKRDAFDGFEQVRTRVRRRLGVVEEPIDDGFETLVRLRDALRADHVVVMQGDRAMAGQRSMVVPFLSGHLRVPIGPVKLALLTGSPIVPVFVVRGNNSRFNIHLGEPILIDAASADAGTVEETLHMLARTQEAFVRQYPTQWLILEPAFVEDQTVGQ